VTLVHVKIVLLCFHNSKQFSFTLLPNDIQFKFLTLKLGYIAENLSGLGSFQVPVTEVKS
jgi:hypothetical protein